MAINKEIKYVCKNIKIHIREGKESILRKPALNKNRNFFDK